MPQIDYSKIPYKEKRSTDIRHVFVNESIKDITQGSVFVIL